MRLTEILAPVRDRNPLELGLLVGVYEALAIVQWDVLMETPALGRLFVGLLWAGIIIGFNMVVWWALIRLFRGLQLATVALFLGGVFTARWWMNDRFVAETLWLCPAGLLLAWKGPRFLQGLLAVVIGTGALWGRVPNIAVAEIEKVYCLLPGAVCAIACGALPWRRYANAACAAAAVAVLAGISLGNAYPEPKQKRPNILFVLVDTLRRDHLAAYGDKGRGSSFERLAREGILFSDAITVVPKTMQSVASIFTGRYPGYHGVRRLRHRLSDDQVTLAEVLRKQGYETVAVVHNGWIKRGRGFEQGFGEFWSWYQIESPYGPLRYTGWMTLFDGLVLKRNTRFDPNTRAGHATDAALRVLARTGGRPFFAYVHYFDPHWPYRPPGQDGECLVNNIKESNISLGAMIFRNRLPRKENKRARKLYRGETIYNNDEVGRLLDWLDRSGKAKDTIVVYTADHGHHLGEHDYYFHHGDFLYEEGLRIPLAIRWPNHLEAGRVIDYQVSTIDLMPTLLSLVGIRAPKQVNGVNALAQAPPPAFLESDLCYFQSNRRRYVPGIQGKLRGVRTSEWKLIYTPKRPHGVWELFNLADDRKEENNLLLHGKGEDHGEKVAELMEVLRRWLPKNELRSLKRLRNRFDDFAPIWAMSKTGQRPKKSAKKARDEKKEKPSRGVTSEEKEMTPEEKEVLRSLGYIE